MKHQILLALTASILLTTVGCSSAPPPVTDTRDADIKAIKDADAAMAKDMASKAFAKRSSYYADDAVLMIPGDPPVRKDGIQGVSKMMLDQDMDLKLASTKVDVAKNGDIGYVHGAYSMVFTEPKSNRRMLEKGNYVNIYKKQADGAWKIIEDIRARDSAPTPVVKTPAVIKTKGSGKKSIKSKAKK